MGRRHSSPNAGPPINLCATSDARGGAHHSGCDSSRSWYSRSSRSPCSVCSASTPSAGRPTTPPTRSTPWSSEPQSPPCCPSAQLERTALVGLARVDEIGIPRPFIVGLTGVDFESIYGENQAELDRNLTELIDRHPDVALPDGDTLGERLTVIEQKLATRARPRRDGPGGRRRRRPCVRRAGLRAERGADLGSDRRHEVDRARPATKPARLAECGGAQRRGTQPCPDRRTRPTGARSCSARTRRGGARGVPGHLRVHARCRGSGRAEPDQRRAHQRIRRPGTRRRGDGPDLEPDSDPGRGGEPARPVRVPRRARRLLRQLSRADRRHRANPGGERSHRSDPHRAPDLDDRRADVAARRSGALVDPDPDPSARTSSRRRQQRPSRRRPAAPPGPARHRNA